ncbi:hypothetical protein K438DRAFT_1998936 [Mycena galopus ATCC 62051]|nr:hypothetical protein K438DRAFT_1998936 [Mycena galopus ATCC 62051]
MLPLMERLRLNQTSNDYEATIENLYGQQVDVVTPQATVTSAASERRGIATGRRSSGYGTNQRNRHPFALELEGDDLFGSDSSSMPELISEVGSVDLGICPFCLGGAHVASFDCPLYGPRLTEHEVVAVEALTSLASREYAQYIQARKSDNRMVLSVATPEPPAISTDIRRAIEAAAGPLRTEWVAPTALHPQGSTAAFRELLESFTTEYDEERVAKEVSSEHNLAKELEEGLREVGPRSVNYQPGIGTPFPHNPAAVLPTSNRTHEPSHTALLDPPTFPRRGKVVDRELWSSSSPSQSNSSVTSETTDSFDVVEVPPANGAPVTRERLETLLPGGWSPAVTEWSVEIPDFLFNPTLVIDEAVARALRAASAGPPTTTASAASSTNATPSSSEEAEAEYVPGPFHRFPRLHLQPNDSEEVQLALYFWLYDGALKQLDARRFEDDFGSEPAEKALRILHGPLRRFVDYTAMAAEGVQALQQLGPFPSPQPLTPISEYDEASEDGLHPNRSPTSLDHSLPVHSHMLLAPTAFATPTDSFADESLPDNHSAEPIELLEEEYSGEAAVDMRFSMNRISSPPIDRKRKHPDGDIDGEFQQGRRQRTFGKFRGDALWRDVIEHEALKAAAARAVAGASADDIRYFGGIRLAILAMLQFLEEVCRRLYSIDETSFPAQLSHHPLLHDLEAAKAHTIWTILQRQGCERLANNLHELLSLRIRGEITDAHLFDAKHLDECYSEQDSRYWDLLREPHVVPVTRAEFAARMGHDDSESDDSEELHLDYPDSEQNDSDAELEMSARRWIHTAPNYYPRGPSYVGRPNAISIDRGAIPHSL